MNLRPHLLAGHVIPAQPLALDAQRKFSERHQRAITRYYVAAGAGGLAVGVHSTQFEIREPQHGLFRPVLELAARTIDEELARAPRPFVKISGICGRTDQALREAELARSLGYQAGLVSLSAFKHDPEAAMVEHCARVAEAIPVVGFYLQPAAGGRLAKVAPPLELVLNFVQVFFTRAAAAVDLPPPRGLSSYCLHATCRCRGRC
jgi:dihydrodipicolinate synthase/N-acetylneuraminate lyase